VKSPAKKLIERFEADLPSRLHNALICIKGDKEIVQSVFNLLTYFCAKIDVNEPPNNDVVSAVAMYLRSAQKEKRYKTKLRHREVRRGIKRLIGDLNELSDVVLEDGVIVGLAEQYHYSETTIREIIAEQSDSVVEFCERGCAGDEVPDDLIMAVAPFVDELRKKIMDDGAKGEEMRNRLGLHGYGWWKSAEDLHREIEQDMAKLKGEGRSQTESLNIVVKRTGLKRGTVQKILRRRRDQHI
jgi:hypothetical protein